MNKTVGRKKKRVDNYTVLRALHLIYLLCLALDRHIFVDDANAAFARNRNRHTGLCDSIHRSGHQRGVQGDILGEFR